MESNKQNQYFYAYLCRFLCKALTFYQDELDLINFANKISHDTRYSQISLQCWIQNYSFTCVLIFNKNSVLFNGILWKKKPTANISIIHQCYVTNLWLKSRLICHNTKRNWTGNNKMFMRNAFGETKTEGKYKILVANHKTSKKIMPPGKLIWDQKLQNCIRFW